MPINSTRGAASAKGFGFTAAGAAPTALRRRARSAHAAVRPDHNRSPGARILRTRPPAHFARSPRVCAGGISKPSTPRKRASQRSPAFAGRPTTGGWRS